MNINANLLSFLQETFQRISQKSPRFFKWWQIISATLTILTGVPWLLDQFNVHPPEPFDSLADKFFAGVGVGLWLMSQMPIRNNPVAQTTEGKPVTVVDEKKMPFTAKDEKAQMEESVPPPPVTPDVPEGPAPETTKKE